MAEQHDYEGDAAECPACLAWRTRRDAAAPDDDAPEPDTDGEGGTVTVGVELPAARATHRGDISQTTWTRLGTEKRGWLIGRDIDQQAGDSVLLYDLDTQELVAAGVIEHVAHAGDNYRGIKQGYVIMSLRDIRPARFAPAEASE